MYRVGMLEWMDHTVPLKQLIEDMMTNKDRIMCVQFLFIIITFV